jgi:glutaredoxin|tara:strand:+ start:1287 stop:1568 length:282 start_codon:yes stop_codon:yes gene_type:complete
MKKRTMDNKIIVYSKNNCVYCVKAKSLLKGLGLTFVEKKLEEFDSVDDMIKDIGKKVRSMPQIKIDGKLIGGYNQLIEHYNNEGLVDFKGNIK